MATPGPSTPRQDEEKPVPGPSRFKGKGKAVENPTLSYNKTVDGLMEFLEVCVHNILYVRQIYPVEIFVRRKIYGTPVFQSRHPDLNEYISGAVKAVREEVIRDKVKRVVMIIKSQKDDVALERYVFSIEQMIKVETYDKDVSVEGALTPLELGAYFRGFLVKLHMMESTLLPLDTSDEELTFAIIVELKEDTAPTQTSERWKDLPPWIPAVPDNTTRAVSDEASTYMIRAVNTGIIDLSLVVQESATKMQRVKAMDERASQAQSQLGESQESQESISIDVDFEADSDD